MRLALKDKRVEWAPLLAFKAGWGGMGSTLVLKAVCGMSSNACFYGQVYEMGYTVVLMAKMCGIGSTAGS